MDDVFDEACRAALRKQVIASPAEMRERIAFLEAERSWLTRKLGRALKYIEDRDGSALAYSFAKHTRQLRPDLPTWDDQETA